MKLRKGIMIVAGVLAATLISAGAFGQILNESAKLLTSDGAAGHTFGVSVSVSGDVAVVGAPFDDDNGSTSGSAYVLRWNGSAWVEEKKLLASDGAAGDRFGKSVSVSGDVAVVGATLDNDNGFDSGSAYVFRWNGSTWIEEQKLLASDGAVSDEFGRSVSVSGDVAVVGAYWDDDNGRDSGSAYVFRWNGSAWVQEQKLLASEGAAFHVFGFSVSVSGDVALVGARSDDDNGSSSGSAYVFRWNGSTWVEERKLLASDGATGDEFGFSVSVSGDVAVVGAGSDDDNGGSSGSAYVFRWNGSTWIEEQKLLASDGATGDFFGPSVSVSGDVAVVGAYLDDDNGTNSGSAYVFRWNGSAWDQEQKLLPSDGAALDFFGVSVSVSGDVAVVGALFDDDNGSDSGSAYVFEIGPPITDCNDNGIDDADEIANCDADPGCGDCDRNQVPDDCQQDDDGDGLIDECDACPQSQPGETITIGQCDTDVANVVFDDGCTMADVLAECDPDPDPNAGRGADAKGDRGHHGDFVTCVNEAARAWRRDGIITGAAFGQIVSCAANSDAGRGPDPIELHKTTVGPKE